MSTSRLEIDLSAIENNLGVVRRVVTEPGGADGDRAAPESRPAPGVCVVLKQDAYGIGAARVAKRLVAAGVDMIAVYTPEEAGAIVEAAADTSVLVLMPIRSLDRLDPVYRHAVSGRVHLCVHDGDQLDHVMHLARTLGTRLPVHVHVDTGMSRGGSLPADAERLVRRIVEAQRLRLAGVMTHFASAVSDAAFTQEQARAFDAWLEPLRGMLDESEVLVHAADSAGTFRSRRYHGSMVRVGQALYGFAIEGASADGTLGKMEFAMASGRLTPAVRWTSSIVHEMTIEAGWPVGYGSTWRAERSSRIALVPVGYADGYLRALGNAGHVGLTGRSWAGGAPSGEAGGSSGVHYAPVVGRVSMDQITIDVTDVPEPFRHVGAEVELIGRDRTAPNHMPRLAAAAGTVTHDVLCAINPRIERVYRCPGALRSRRDEGGQSEGDGATLARISDERRRDAASG